MNYNTVYVEWMFTRKVFRFVLTQLKLKRLLTTRGQRLITKKF